jgi:hypothetical protein
MRWDDLKDLEESRALLNKEDFPCLESLRIPRVPDQELNEDEDFWLD